MSAGASVEDAIAAIKGIYTRWTRSTTVAQMRADWDAAFAPLARDWPREKVDACGVPAEWISPPGRRPTNAMLYLHGGGFRLGSIDSHRDLMQRLAQAAGARVLAIDYRLSPEHIFPAALDDAGAAWRWLVEHSDGETCAIAGDSAGGGLALSTMLRARDEGLLLPSVAYLMSPWTDLAATGASYETHAARDPIHQRSMLQGMAKGYLGPNGDARDPLASPLYADLKGLPPMLIQCGGREVILDDSRGLAERARAVGVIVDLQVYETMIHAFPMFADLPESFNSFRVAGDFLRSASHG